MKKFMYGVVLIGGIVLVGCSENEESEEQVQINQDITKSVTNGQEVALEPLDLTQEQKVDYYKQYGEIIKMVNSEYDEDLELEPFNDFLSNEEWWVEPKYFRQIAVDMANLEFTSKTFGGDPVE